MPNKGLRASFPVLGPLVFSIGILPFMEIALNRGNWVPISKALVKKLPTDREFSEVEAMFSLTVNYDCVNPVSVSGLASRWMWSRKRVDNFLKKLGVTIEYEDKFDRHKRGQVGYQVGNRSGTSGEQVEFIDSKYLPATGNRWGTGGEQVGNRKGSTIKEPNPNPKPKEDNVGQKPRRRVPYKEIIDFFNETTGKDFKHTTNGTKSHIKARFNEGFSLGDFKDVIQAKYNEWKCDEKMEQYIRPATLFGAKFESYLQSAQETGQQKSKWVKN